MRTRICWRIGIDASADAEGLSNFLAQFAVLQDPAISRMEFTGFFAPEMFDENYQSEANQESIAKQRAVYGADESRSVVAGFPVDRKAYLFCCDVARYGDAWYLLGLSGNIGTILGIAVNAGGIMPLSP